MWQRIKNNLLGLGALVIGLLTAAFVYEREQKEQADAKLDIAKSSAQDAALAQQQTDDQKQIAVLKASESVPNPTDPTTVVTRLDNL